MNPIMSHFLFVKDDVLSIDTCESIINDIDNYIDLPHFDGKIISGSESNGIFNRQDLQIFMPNQIINNFEEIINCTFDSLEEYAKHIFTCKLQTLVTPVAKLQKTEVGGGFHNWHIEQGGGSSSNRVIAWMIYLNDIEKGGETEFLYQQRKVEAKAGRIVLWPAGMTHPHRGNPPYSNTKYIVTGWFEVAPHDVYNTALEYVKDSASQ